MNICLCGLREALKKILQQLHLKVANSFCGDLGVHCAIRPATQVNGRSSESFVHGHQEIAGTQNASLRAKSSSNCLAKRNAHVFYSVVLIYVQVATGIHLQVKSAMTRNEIQHVVEEANSGGNRCLSTPIQIELQPDIRLVRFPMNCRRACHNSVQFLSSPLSRRLPFFSNGL